MRYVKYFETSNQFNKFTLDDTNTPNISLVEELISNANGGLTYTPYIPHDYSKNYFTLKAIQNCSFDINLYTEIEDEENIETFGYIQYSTDNGETWSEEYGKIENLSVSAGNKVLIKGLTKTCLFDGAQASDIEGSWITSTGNYEIEGNIMSLFFGDNFENQLTMNIYNSLYRFFYGDTHLINAENLILPATLLAEKCYSFMFANCSALVNAPKVLPAASLETECYNSMFYGCTSLVSAPELPATILADNCYEYMFYECTSLVTAPELPAVSLTNAQNDNTLGCYGYMFMGCTALVNAPELPAYRLSNQCYAYMFKGCTSLVTAPDLCASEIQYYSYAYMFEGCTSLNHVLCLANNGIDGNTTIDWLKGVSETGTFIKRSGIYSWESSDSGIPENWTVEEYGPNPGGGEESSSSSSSSSL